MLNSPRLRFAKYDAPATAQTLLYASLAPAATRQVLRPATIPPENASFLHSTWRQRSGREIESESARSAQDARSCFWRCLVCSRLRSTNSKRRGTGAPHTPPEFPLENSRHAAKCLSAGARNPQVVSYLLLPIDHELGISCERLATVPARLQYQ